MCSFLLVVLFVICGTSTFFRPEKKDKEATLMTRTGGAYIPPAKLRMMQQAITDKTRYASRYMYLMVIQFYYPDSALIDSQILMESYTGISR